MSDSINFEQLRKEAKTILKLCRAADRTALDRMRIQLPRLAALSQQDIAAQIKLADVHHALARELGHANWGELKRHDDPVARFLAAVRSGALKSAQQELQRSPNLARENVHAACALGDADAVRHHIDLDPGLVSVEASGWQPLLYVCGSPFHRLSLRHAFGLHECAHVLLDRGADPNAFSFADPSDPASKIHARVRAGMSRNRLVHLLLTQRGAIGGDLRAVKAAVARSRPVQDPVNTSLLAFLDDPGFREELNRRLAPIRARRPQPPHPPAETSIKQMLALGRDDDNATHDANLALFQLALERGADPNRLCSPNNDTMLHTCAKMEGDSGKALAELFLAHGADPDLAAADGSTPYSVAVRMGNTIVADLMLAHGARPDSLSPADQFLGACRRVDADAARSILRSHPDIRKIVTSECNEILADAAKNNQIDVVRLLAELGFDLAAFGDCGASALHLAAWFGHLEMVRLLLGYDAPVNITDAVYRTAPLAWAVHGSTNSKSWRDDDHDYRAVISSLIDAGAH